MSAPTLFVIAKDLTRMQVEASIDEADIGRIEPGQPVTFRVDAYPRESFTGTVVQVRLEPHVVQNVVSYVTVIDVPNPNGKLKPGMTANVEIEIARADDVLIVPNAATRFQPETQVGGTSGSRGRRVWTLHDGELQPVRIETGITNGTATAIVGDGLQEGMPVVIGVVAANQPADTASPASPLVPQRPRGNRQAAGRRGPQ
jgi:HlyD family secretion protein